VVESLRIYIASSWKNAEIVFNLAYGLRSQGYQVDAFVDNSMGRYVFDWREIVTNKNDLNAISFLKNKKAKRAFREDNKWLDWCNVCLLVLPAGNSSHLEAGYIKGQGKKLIIFAPHLFPYGEFDVMYGFADLLSEDLQEVDDTLRRWQNDPTTS